MRQQGWARKERRIGTYIKYDAPTDWSKLVRVQVNNEKLQLS